MIFNRVEPTHVFNWFPALRIVFACVLCIVDCTRLIRWKTDSCVQLVSFSEDQCRLRVMADAMFYCVPGDKNKNVPHVFNWLPAASINAA